MPAADSTVQSKPPIDSSRVFLFLHALRRSFIWIAALVAVFSIVGYLAAEPALRRLQHLTGVKLAAYGIPETFFTFLTLALAFGVLMSMPYILYAVLAGLQPLFPSFSLKMMRRFWAASIVLFFCGAAFCLTVSLPYGVQFLMSFEGPHIEAIISVQKFAGFCMLFVFGFGLIFELPLAMILLGRVGVVRRQVLARNRRYAILAITIVAAVLTPTPDAFNLALMAVPLYLLFEIGLLGMGMSGKEPAEARASKDADGS
jgi:sec-independent protein translocase protein TatC